MKRISIATGLVMAFAFTSVSTIPVLAAGDKIVHDAEYTILEAQHGERWAAEDSQIEARLPIAHRVTDASDCPVAAGHQFQGDNR